MQPDAVIDHRAVEPAECAFRLGDQRRALRLVARIERHGDGAPALGRNRASDRLAVRRGAAGDRDTSAGFGEAGSQLGADATPGAGDDVRAILEIEQRCSRHA